MTCLETHALTEKDLVGTATKNGLGRPKSGGWRKNVLEDVINTKDGHRK